MMSVGYFSVIIKTQFSMNYSCSGTEDSDVRVVGFAASYVEDNLIVNELIVEKHSHVIYTDRQTYSR